MMGRHTSDPGGPEGRDDVDAAFAEIVADLEREGFGTTTPAVDEEPGDKPCDAAPRPSPDSGDGGDQPAFPGATRGWRVPETEWDWASASETEHYVPPEPPPLPRLKVSTIAALLLAAIGVFLLVAPGVLGLPVAVGAPIAVALLVTAAGFLLLRLRTKPPDDPDDGAAV